ARSAHLTGLKMRRITRAVSIDRIAFSPLPGPDCRISEANANANYQIRQRIRARSETVTHWPMIITAKAPSLSFMGHPHQEKPSPGRRLSQAEANKLLAKLE